MSVTALFCLLVRSFVRLSRRIIPDLDFPSGQSFDHFDSFIEKKKEFQENESNERERGKCNYQKEKFFGDPFLSKEYSLGF